MWCSTSEQLHGNFAILPAQLSVIGSSGDPTSQQIPAVVGHRNLPKLKVAGSNLVSRSNKNKYLADSS